MVDLMKRWAINMASGGKPLLFEGSSSFPVVASADGKFSIVCLSHQLRVYFLQTRQCIRTVDLDLKDTISVFLDPENSRQVIVFSKKQILHVNWAEKVQTPTVASQKIEPAIRGLREVFKVTSTSYFALAEADGAFSIYRIDKETAASSQVFSLPNVRHACVSSNGHQFAVVAEKTIQLYDISAAFADGPPQDCTSVIANTKETFPFYGRPTCMAASNSGMVAVGLTSGAIHMVYGGSVTGQPQRTLRWHIDPVTCLAFSADEVYLVSGGNEKVLVFWHLDSDRTQFLPRLSGPIDRIYVDPNRPDHYSVALRVYEGPQKSQFHELLTLSAVDLVSRLSVSPVCPNFKNCADQLIKMARRGAKSKNHESKQNKLRISDLTAPVVVHPTSKHLYFARDSSMQAFDAIKGEQAFVQHAAPQVSTGRVKSEHKTNDPVVSQIAFTSDGSWMATFDSMPKSNFDNLMSKNDVSYALKFWKLTDSTWTLASKVVEPHGVGREIGAIVSQNGTSFTTIDKCGGIRLWRPRSNVSGTHAASDAKNIPVQSVWTLRRSSPVSSPASAVSACYSADRSLLFVSHGSSIHVHEPESLHRINFALPLMDSPVQSLNVTGTYLIIASARRVVSYDLVAACETPLCVQVTMPGSGNLCAVDPHTQIVALATNEIEEDSTVIGRLFLFKPDSLKPIFSSSHPAPIASLTYTPAGFIFIDTDTRIGYIVPEAKSRLADAMEDDLTSQMHKVLDTAQAAANVLFSRPVEENGQMDSTENAAKWATHKNVDVSLLQPIFANTEGVSLESLFDRITRLVQ